MPLCDSSETYARAVQLSPSPADLLPGLTAGVSRTITCSTLPPPSQCIVSKTRRTSSCLTSHLNLREEQPYVAKRRLPQRGHLGVDSMCVIPIEAHHSPCFVVMTFGDIVSSRTTFVRENRHTRNARLQLRYQVSLPAERRNSKLPNCLDRRLESSNLTHLLNVEISISMVHWVQLRTTHLAAIAGKFSWR
jgi:hypothetical protein